EGFFDPALGTRRQHEQLASERDRGCPCVLRIRFGVRIVWVDDQGQRRRSWHYFIQQLQPFWKQQVGKKTYAGNIAVRAVEACYETLFDRVLAHGEDDGD